ncbi:MAG TPA: hypothetical protein VF984_04475 [Actinomycetota bacterium]
MRLLLVSSAVVAIVALGACDPPTQGPAQPLALEQVGAGIGPDVAAARQTVLDFLQAYADAPADDGVALSGLVAGAKLGAWAQWLAVQNRDFDGTIVATVDVRSVEFVAFHPIQGRVGAQVDLGASVTFTFDPTEGDPFRRTRILDGPVTLLRAGEADWRVVDATRDGISMDAGIELFQHLRQRRHGVTVRLDSLFQFTPNWQFNVIVANHSGWPIRLDRRVGASLYTKRHGGSARRQGAITPSLVLVPDGATIQGLAAFPLQSSARGRVVALTYRIRHGGLIRFAFALAGKVTPVGAPPTASPAAPVAPS